MNWERFDQLIDHVRDVETSHFNMSWWVKTIRYGRGDYIVDLLGGLKRDRKTFKCGTTLCLAGHAGYLAVQFHPGIITTSRPIVRVALDWLEASPPECAHLEQIFSWTSRWNWDRIVTRPSHFVGILPSKRNVLATMRKYRRLHPDHQGRPAA